MVRSLIICGSHSFSREEDEDYQDERAVRSAGSSPRKSSRAHSKNPYSARGLDTFSALLAEIEEKREQIYSEISPDEISFLQFDYSKGNKCKPIVVKAKPVMKKKKQQQKTPLDQPLQEHHAPTERSRSEAGPAARALPERRVQLRKLNRPKYYLPVVVIVILMFLVLFGRSVAIMCTSIGWYLIPSIANGDCCGLRRNSFKKKGLVGPQGGGASFKGLSHGNRSSSPS